MTIPGEHWTGPPKVRLDVPYRCFACDRVIRRRDPLRADTRDGQWVFVGTECYRHILNGGTFGYQPSKGGPRLFPMPEHT